MSYPQLIQVLIIEDESTDLYDAVFEEPVKQGLLAPSMHAYGFDEAASILNSDSIIHLVILDLRLPVTSRLPAPEGVGHGLKLLELCANRNTYPIPAILVVSAHINQADQLDLDNRMRSFAYGRVLVKPPKESSLLRAVDEVKSYTRKGIHIRDSGSKEYPTLSPREEDLLRRCMNEQPSCTGVDIKWWSAEYLRPTGSYATQMGWTKVLTGRFLFGASGHSRPNFFKFDQADGYENIVGDIQVIKHKLAHVKVNGTLYSGDRSLLVTEKVGSRDDDPTPLGEYLLKTAHAVQPTIPKLVTEVVEQLRALGNVIEQRAIVGHLLWPHHDRARLIEEWAANGGGELVRSLNVDPIQLFDDLRADGSEHIMEMQSFLHGDLNISNVAIDCTDPPAAYIFDPSGTLAGVRLRDLAMLEVSSLLHQTASKKDSLVAHCERFYQNGLLPPSDFEFASGSDLARNTAKLLAEIRRYVSSTRDPHIYALMVFDNALVQLGGLAFGRSQNKIQNPKDAALLAVYAARWLKALRPEQS